MTSSENKWRPIIKRVDALRRELFGADWTELEPEDVAYDLIPVLYREARGRGGDDPSNNTLRGRYDAANAFFAFLVITRRLASNPCDFLAAPSSKASDQPWLTPSEDRKLFELEKSMLELGVYALARGAALRAGEIAALDDRDVDLVDRVIIVRGGKTKNALRRVPILPATAELLTEYLARRRESDPRPSSSKFIRTRTGAITEGYIWKLVKSMAVRAEVGLVAEMVNGVTEFNRDPHGELITRITPHALRRTWGSDLVNRGVPTVVVSKLMGHASPRVTEESYVRLTDDQRTRQILLAGGPSPFSIAASIERLGSAAAAAASATTSVADGSLEEIARIRAELDALEALLVGHESLAAAA